MSLTDEPFYKEITGGLDTKLIVGTLTSMVGPRSETFALFLVDYHGFRFDMESAVADALDDVKKINLNVKDGVYSVGVEDRGTVVVFAKGERAQHTAPAFWAQYTPKPEEHEAFQRELSRLGLWMLMVITKEKLRELVVAQDGTVLFKRTVPLTDELKKMLGVE